MPRFKSHLVCALVLTLLASSRSLNAQENRNPIPVPASETTTSNQTGGKSGSSTPAPHELELAVELKLFNDLAEEHRQRAEEATTAGNTGLADWELNIEKEFRARSASADRSLREIANAPLPEAKQPAGEPSATAPNKAVSTPEEVAFFSKLDDRLSQVTSDLAAALESARNLALQMTTNNIPDYATDLSNLMHANAREIRELQREQWYVEMKKLEFRAIRKQGSTTANASGHHE